MCYISNNCIESQIKLWLDSLILYKTLKYVHSNRNKLTTCYLPYNVMITPSVFSTWTWDGFSHSFSEYGQFQNTCAASGCLGFPDASWQKSRQFYLSSAPLINTQTVVFHVENNSMKEVMWSVKRGMIRLLYMYYSHFNCALAWKLIKSKINKTDNIMFTV